MNTVKVDYHNLNDKVSYLKENGFKIIHIKYKWTKIPTIILSKPYDMIEEMFINWKMNPKKEFSKYFSKEEIKRFKNGKININKDIAERIAYSINPFESEVLAEFILNFQSLYINDKKKLKRNKNFYKYWYDFYIDYEGDSKNV